MIEQEVGFLPSIHPLKINSVIVKTPHAFQISHYNLTKHGRVASGNMTMDLLKNGKKKKLFLEYRVITGADLQHIYDRIHVWSNGIFFYVTYFDEIGEAQTITCYVGEIAAPLARRGQLGDHQIFKDVVFNFIER